MCLNPNTLIYWLLYIVLKSRWEFSKSLEVKANMPFGNLAFIIAVYEIHHSMSSLMQSDQWKALSDVPPWVTALCTFLDSQTLNMFLFPQSAIHYQSLYPWLLLTVLGKVDFTKLPGQANIVVHYTLKTIQFTFCLFSF